MNRITVIAKNEVGVIADITRALADAEINIETISAEGLDDHGTVTLTTDAQDAALRVLMSAGFKAVSDESLVLRLPDEPGALGQSSRAVQAGRREHTEPAYPRAPSRPHHRCACRRRSRKSRNVGG